MVQIEHKERLNNIQDPVIYIFNHNNSTEVFLVPAILMFYRNSGAISFLIDWMFGKIPLLGWIFNIGNPIYVYNKKSPYRIIERMRPNISEHNVYQNCIERINDKKSIGVFPEGKRNKNPNQLLRGRKGVANIVLTTGVPVVPIGIDFKKRMERGVIPNFGSLIMRIGEPMLFHNECQLYQQMELEQQNEKILKKMKFQLIENITHIMMSRLGELSGKQYPFSAQSS